MSFRKVAILSISLIFIATLRLVRLHSLNQKQIELDNFYTFELVEIYLLGIAMAVLGYPLFPEAAEEHFRLMLQHDKRAPIEANGGFFLKSKVVNSGAKQACREQRTVNLRWNASAYEATFNYSRYTEARASLALNGGSITCESGIPYALINISYPKNAKVTFVRLGGYPIIQVQEGLFHLLEQKGWYQSYHYKWELNES